MLLRGQNTIDLKEGQTIKILADSAITVNKLSNKEFTIDHKDSESIDIQAEPDQFYTIALYQRHENLDNTPVEVALLSKPPSVRDEMRQMVTQMLQERYGHDEFESFDEANDFDLDDEIDLVASKYEVQEMTPEEMELEPIAEPVTEAPPEPSTAAAELQPTTAPAE